VRGKVFYIALMQPKVSLFDPASECGLEELILGPGLQVTAFLVLGEPISGFWLELKFSSL